DVTELMLLLRRVDDLLQPPQVVGGRYPLDGTGVGDDLLGLMGTDEDRRDGRQGGQAAEGDLEHAQATFSSKLSQAIELVVDGVREWRDGRGGRRRRLLAARV